MTLTTIWARAKKLAAIPQMVIAYTGLVQEAHRSGVSAVALNEASLHFNQTLNAIKQSFHEATPDVHLAIDMGVRFCVQSILTADNVTKDYPDLNGTPMDWDQALKILEQGCDFMLEGAEESGAAKSSIETISQIAYKCQCIRSWLTAQDGRLVDFFDRAGKLFNLQTIFVSHFMPMDYASLPNNKDLIYIYQAPVAPTPERPSP